MEIGTGSRLYAANQEWWELVGTNGASGVLMSFMRDEQDQPTRTAFMRRNPIWWYFEPDNTILFVTTNSDYRLQNRTYLTGVPHLLYYNVDDNNPDLAVFADERGVIPYVRTPTAFANQFPDPRSYIGRALDGTLHGGFTVFWMGNYLPTQHPLDLQLAKIYNAGRGVNLRMFKPFVEGVVAETANYLSFDRPNLETSRLRLYFRSQRNKNARSTVSYAYYNRVNYDASYADLNRIFFAGPYTGDRGVVRNSIGIGYGNGFSLCCVLQGGSLNSGTIPDGGYLINHGGMEWLLQGGGLLFYNGDVVGPSGPVTGISLPLNWGAQDTFCCFTSAQDDAARSFLIAGTNSLPWYACSGNNYQNQPMYIGGGKNGGNQIFGWLSYISYWGRPLTRAEADLIGSEFHLDGRPKAKGQVPGPTDNHPTLSWADPLCLVYIEGKRSDPGDTFVPGTKGDGMDLLDYVTNSPNLNTLFPARIGRTVTAP